MFPPPAGSALAIVFALVSAAALIAVVGLGSRAPLLLRMVGREVLRRRGRTTIMIVGLSLSVVFITAAFGLQDSLRSSAVAYRVAQVGRIDEAVTGLFTPSEITRANQVLARNPSVRAAADVYMSDTATAVRADSSSSPVSAYLYGVAHSFGAVYGSLINEHGDPIATGSVGGGEVILSRSAAERLNVGAGDRVNVTWDAVSVTARVLAVLDNDPVFTTGELNQDTAIASVIAPLSALERAFREEYHHTLPADAICVRNRSLASSPMVVAALERFFGVDAIDPASPHGTFAPTYFDETLIHPLQPTVVDYTGGLSQLTSKAEYTSSPAARQANWLQPAFTILLVGAGLLLAALQCMLLALERRAEFGIGRALGLQRRHVVTAMAIEGSLYALAAAVIGVPLGALTVDAEVAVLNHLPTVSLASYSPFQFADVTLHAALRWQSALVAGALGVLAVLLVIVAAATAVSATTIVAALRDLGEPTQRPQSLAALAKAVVAAVLGRSSEVIADTRARRRERVTQSTVRLAKALISSGPMPLAAGIALIVAASFESPPQTLGLTLIGPVGVRELGVALLIAGGGLMLASLTREQRQQGRLQRLATTAIGAGWIVFGVIAGHQFLRAMFALNLTDTGLSHTGPYSVLEVAIDLMLPLAGTIVICLCNADAPAQLLTALMRHTRPLAAIGRPSLSYPLTFRGRTAVTVTLLGSVTYLVMLLLASNAAVAGHSQTSGGPYTAVLTAFLSGYLGLGLLFGALAIGVVAHRAVAERHHEIGMLRALGFTRTLIAAGFVVETAFVTALGLIPATALAWLLVAEIAHLNHEHPTIPLATSALLLCGAFAVACVAVAVPARQASRIPPAQALRAD